MWPPWVEERSKQAGRPHRAAPTEQFYLDRVSGLGEVQRRSADTAAPVMAAGVPLVLVARDRGRRRATPTGVPAARLGHRCVRKGRVCGRRQIVEDTEATPA